jgi:hypothetical protein
MSAGENTTETTGGDGGADGSNRSQTQFEVLDVVERRRQGEISSSEAQRQIETLQSGGTIEQPEPTPESEPTPEPETETETETETDSDGGGSGGSPTPPVQQPTQELEDDTVEQSDPVTEDPPDASDISGGRSEGEQGNFGEETATEEEIEVAAGSDEFTDEQVQQLREFSALDRTGDGVVTDADAQAAAESGDFRTAREIEQTVDSVLGTADDSSLSVPGVGSLEQVAPSEEQIQSADDSDDLQEFAALDVTNDNIITDADARQAAASGNFETAREIEQTVDSILGTQNDGLNKELFPTGSDGERGIQTPNQQDILDTVADVRGGDADASAVDQQQALQDVDTNSDGVITRTDLEALADRGQADTAQSLARSIPTVDAGADAFQAPTGSDGQRGIEAPDAFDIEETVQEFREGDASADDVEQQQSLQDVAGEDGVITRSDLKALADRGAVDSAQSLAESVPGVSSDSDALDAPTVTDVVGDDGQVSSASEADELVETAAVSDAITENQVEELLEQTADEGGIFTDNSVSRSGTQAGFGDEFADESGSPAFSRFGVRPPDEQANADVGSSRISTDGELILDRRGSTGFVESVQIGGQEVEINRRVGPSSEAGGDETRDRLTIDIPAGVEPGVRDITIEESFGPNRSSGTETTEVEALLTDDATAVDNPGFEEQFEGVQDTGGPAPEVISGDEAEALLGADVVDEQFGGDQEEAAQAVSEAITVSDQEAQSALDATGGGEVRVTGPSDELESAVIAEEIGTIIEEGDAEPDFETQTETPEPTPEPPTGEAVIGEGGSLVNTENEVTQVGDEAQQQADIDVDGLAGNVGSVTDPDAETETQTETQTQTETGGTTGAEVQAGREIDAAVGRANRNVAGRREAAQAAAEERAETQLGMETDEAAADANRRLAGRREAAQEQAEEETFGDIPIQNPLTGNRVQDDLDTIAGGFEDATETAFANLGRVQPTPGTLGVGGTRTADETTEGIRGAGLEGFIGSINPGEVARSVQETGEFFVTRGDEVGQEVLEPTADLLAGNEIDTSTELRRDLAGEGARAAEAARENPGETAAGAIGGGVGGFAGGFAAAQVGRGALRGARNADVDVDVDLDDVAEATLRGRQRGPGTSSITGGDIDAINDILGPRQRFRQRREPGRDLPDEQEQIERTEQIERDQERETVGEDTLEELARRQGIADDVSEIEQQARSRLPPQRAFDSDAEFQRELERAMRDIERQRRQAQSDADAETETRTETETETRTRTPELAVGGVDGLGSGFGQVSAELEPEIPRADITTPTVEQRQRLDELTAVSPVDVGGRDDDPQETVTVTDDPQRPRQRQDDETTAGVIGGRDGQPGGETVTVTDDRDADTEASVGVGVTVGQPGERQTETQTSLEDEIAAGVTVGQPEEIGIQDEIDIQEEVGAQNEVSIQDETGIQTQIGEQAQAGSQDQVTAQDITATQISDTPPEMSTTSRPPTPALPGSDDDEEEPTFEDVFQGVRAVDATLETQEIEFE